MRGSGPGFQPHRRLATQFAAFGLAVLALTAFLAFLIARQQEERFVFWTAERLVHDAARRTLDDGVPAFGAVQVYLADDAAARSRLPETVRSLGPGHHLVEGPDEVQHVVVRDVGGRRVVAVYGDGPHRESVERFGRLLLGLVAVLGAAVFAYAHWWAKVVLQRRPSLMRRSARNASAAAGRGAGADPPGAEVPAQYARYDAARLGSLQREREFIANVGHELRTPITLVLTGCELLLESDRLTERDREQLHRIAHAAEHMSELVRSFMILAREGDFGSSENVALRTLVLDAVAPHRDDLQRRRVVLQVNVNADATVTANREAAFVVISNLVRNAVKYTDRGSIAIHYIGQTLYVVDSGCGIEEEDLSRVFLPFYRARAAAESGRYGLGLGLTIVKRICDHYGWPIAIRSRVGQGTSVSVEFLRSGSLLR